MRSAVIVLGLMLFLVGKASGGDWITAPSYYTHDPQTGERTQQYTPIGPFYVQPRSDYLRSGYRHTRSSIQAGESVDQLHVVEQWGAPVRPYDEWRFPYRPYSVPYPLWGPPFAGMNLGFVPPLPFPYSGHPSYPPSSPQHPYPHVPYQGGVNQPPWIDGNYNEYREPRLPDQHFFQPPIDEP